MFLFIYIILNISSSPVCPLPLPFLCVLVDFPPASFLKKSLNSAVWEASQLSIVLHHLQSCVQQGRGLFNMFQSIKTCGAFTGASCCDGDGGSDGVILYL